jgi:hypothetical protein
MGVDAPLPPRRSPMDQAALARQHWKTNLAILGFTAAATLVLSESGAESFTTIAYWLSCLHGVVHLMHRYAFARDRESLPLRVRRVAERYLDPRAITHLDLYAYWLAAFLIARHI